MINNALVSAVIPTRNRPELVSRAVRSVLCQTYAYVEVVVVVDGPDPATVNTLKSLQDARIRVIALTENVGGSEARNIGVRAARGEWIGLLDDDDEWLPTKTEVQLRAALARPTQPAILASQYIDRRKFGDMIRPQKFYHPGQAISEYLYCDISMFRPRQGFLQTSTLFFPKSLIDEVPFTQGLKRNQDADWLLRVVHNVHPEIYTVPEILAIFHNEENSGRIGSNLDWEYSRDWAVDNRFLFTRRAISVFLSSYCLQVAMAQRAGFEAVYRLARDCVKYGKTTPLVAWFFLRYAMLTPIVKPMTPARLLHGIRRIIHK